MIKRLFYFYRDEFLSGISKKKTKKNEEIYQWFALIFGILPFLVASVIFSPQIELVYFFLLGFIISMINILFYYKSSIINFIINLLLITLYVEVDYLYDGEYIVYSIVIAIIGLFFNNLVFNKKGFGQIIKLSSFSIYYFTSGFLSTFQWITQRINIVFIIFPIIYGFILIEIYALKSITIFDNIITNGIVDELKKHTLLNNSLFVYLTIFFIANYKRIFSFFNRIKFFSISFFIISQIFIVKWLLNSGITDNNIVVYFYYFYNLFGFWYIMYAIYLPLLKPKVVNEIDYGNNRKSFAVQILEKDKKISFYNYIKYCDKKYINENYKYHSELDDQPVDGIQKEDILKRCDFVSYLNNVISSITVDIRNKKSYKSYSIGLVGSWGEGKTSIINMLQRKYLDINSIGINSICFNPWNYKKEDLVLSFFNEIEDALGYGYDKDFHAYLNTLGYLGTTGSILSKIFLGVSSMLYGDRSINIIKEKINKKLSDRNEILLVIIDDLDRCTPEEVILMLNILKNLGDLSNIIYIVSYDKVAIENILKQNGYIENYLDKVVNQELFVPLPKQEDKNKYINNEINNILDFISKNYFYRKTKIKQILKIALNTDIEYEINYLFKENNLRTIKKVLNLFKYNLINFLDLLEKRKLIGSKYNYQRKNNQLLVLDISPKEIAYRTVINLLMETKASIINYELYNIIINQDIINLNIKYGSKINEVIAKSNFDDYLIKNFLEKKLDYDNNGINISYDKIGEVVS